LVIEPNSSTNREIIYYTSVSGNSVVCPSVGAGRGQEGTSALAHSSGVAVKRNTTSRDFEVLQDMTATGDDKVLARHINWAGTGANGGIWWEELGRTTLDSAADTITVSSLATRKYLQILINVLNTGTIDLGLQFNNDTGSNYAIRVSVNGGADATSVSQTSLNLFTAVAGPVQAQVYVTNVATVDKIATAMVTTRSTAGAAASPQRRDLVMKWANTSDQITRVDVKQADTGDMASGSEVIVLGHD